MARGAPAAVLASAMAGLPLGQGTQALHDAIRRPVPELDDDHWMSPDLLAAIDPVNSGEFRDLVRRAESTTAGTRT
jgi:histidine ammonia-lyase